MFVLVADGLNNMICMVQEAWLVQELAWSRSSAFTNLQYADDTWFLAYYIH